MAAFQTPPPRLVEAGAPAFGRFTAAPREVNLLDARLGSLPRPLRSLRMKCWQALQLVSEELFLHVALFDARLLSMLQVRVYDRVRGLHQMHERLLRPGAFTVATRLDDTDSAYRDRRSSLCFANRSAAGELRVTFEVAGDRADAALEGALTVDLRPATHQVACMPLDNGGAMYAHKGLFPAEGSVRIGSRVVALRPGDGLALIDQQLGTYPYVMEWDWATAAARTASGQALGFNLTRNQCAAPERYDECCAWLGERVAALPPVIFAREEREGAAQWRIRDRSGRVDLTFVPRIAHDVRVNALAVESRYQGPLGTFAGQLAPDGMPPLRVDGWFGMAERFWLRC